MKSHVINGVPSTDTTEMSQHAYTNFPHILGNGGKPWGSLNSDSRLPDEKVSDLESSHLCQDISVEEVLTSINSMNPAHIYEYTFMRVDKCTCHLSGLDESGV